MALLNANHDPVYYEPLMVRIWADDTFTLVEDYDERDFKHMSDDYEDIDITDPDHCTHLDPSFIASVFTDLFS